jgi:hypothetical protein
MDAKILQNSFNRSIGSQRGKPTRIGLRPSQSNARHVDDVK